MKRAALIILLLVCITNCKTIEPISRVSPKPLANSEVHSNSGFIFEESQIDLSFVSEAFRDFVPEVQDVDRLLDYNGFILEFDTASRNAKWVSYMLCRANLGSGEERSSNFRMDRRLGDYSPRDAAYKNSGYDRGHLAPAADMAYSAESMYDSFYLTNASPQVPGFNRGIWKRLEEQIRRFASEKDSIFVVTGPVLSEQMNSMSTSNIGVPELFFKVVMDKRGNQGIGFLMRNETASGKLSEFAVTIDSVEMITRINFFPLLDTKQEAQAESKFDLKYWFGD
ncbi:DNA/RNA non-specific endonuclease [Belliella sp. DSM 111904]|uniref:Endonuclease n=1 Tax=Belliella filtrata TaxID=2923435 RepID=A0ABS9V4W1_9BACT|nr:DNA/RNA non-specific endonuclease [Belliella filtrata]MCH7411023.1 DNA/RNA non-specific endonuclease [Belliella filtrata]